MFGATTSVINVSAPFVHTPVNKSEPDLRGTLKQAATRFNPFAQTKKAAGQRVGSRAAQAGVTGMCRQAIGD